MNTKLFVATAALTTIVGCAVTPDQTAQTEGDVSQSYPPAGTGSLLKETLYFSNQDDAAKALVGYNYVLTLLSNGRVQAIVTGLNGSGLENPLSVVKANSQKSLANIGDLPSSDETESPFPQISLKEKLNGQAAVDALGDNLALVAKAYGMSAERLENILKSDQTAWIDQGGRLLYIESDIQPDPKQGAGETATADSADAATAEGSGSTYAAIAASTTDPFTLHSKPDSNRVIYLDFNGHQAINTTWYNGTLTAQAYDTDGNPNGFSTTELNNIREIWQRVAEDYAPFDVDVTTQEPAADAMQRLTSSDTQYGTRAVITRSMPELCGQVCGGVAYVNVFSSYSSTSPNRYQPAWAFFDKLGNGNPKYVAEAVSHEVGHNLSLYHDGTASVGYYSGHGSGATGWAPLMGVGYYKPVSQWSKGEYPGANNAQDDLAVISAAGAPIRVDDFPDSMASAAPLSGDPTSVVQTGIIERNTDLDVFTFYTDGGDVQFNAVSGSVAGNLDITLKLFDASGKSVSEVNPVDSLSASLSATLNAGQYFLQIDGVGKGDLTTGYSDYASLGQYQITGSYPKNVVKLIPPTAVISALPTASDAPSKVTFNGTGSSDPDGTIVGYDWNYGDGSTNGSTASVDHTYGTPGNYTATLTVTDNVGLKNSATQSINVAQAPVNVSMKVSSTAIIRRLLTGGKSECLAKVTVKYGEATLANATVNGSWSCSAKTSTGNISKTWAKSAVTGSTGIASISSSSLPTSSSGTCAYTVSNVVKNGYTYDGSGQVAASFTW
ncbi:PKD domain-containing protein [Methylococcaceae bacterium WWC4]|nr:PKD domain-containing protein [Methylococcaceae bacterium WWC4]